MADNSWKESIPSDFRGILDTWEMRLDNPIEIVRSVTKNHENKEIIKETIPVSNTELLDNKLNVFKDITDLFIKCNENNVDEFIEKIKMINVPKESFDHLNTKIINVINSVPMRPNITKYYYSKLFMNTSDEFIKEFMNVASNKLTPELLNFFGHCYTINKELIDIDSLINACYTSNSLDKPRDIITFVSTFKKTFDISFIDTFVNKVTELFPKETSSGLNKFNLMSLKK